MELKDRITQVMESEKLSPSLFADKVGVQRSSISHIISGRNKPSLDFIQKILVSFPKYNTDWLLLGKGEPYRKPSQSSIFDQIPNDEQPKKDLTTPINQQEPHKTTDEPQVKDEEPGEYNTMGHQPKEKGQKPVVSGPISGDVEQIVVFYKDGTFKSFAPR